MKSLVIKIIGFCVLLLALQPIKIICAPTKPVIISASVINEQGHVKIIWQQTDAHQISQYEINRWESSYATVFIQASEAINIAADTFYWIDNNAVALSQRSLYQLRSVDVNDVVSLPSNEMATIFLQQISQTDNCLRSITLQWSEYGIGSVNQISNYRLRWVSATDNGSNDVATNNLQIVGDLPMAGNNSFRPPIYRHTISGLNAAIQYDFFIEAIIEALTELPASNRRQGSLDPIPQPIPPQINFITVNSSQKVELHAQVNTQNSIRTSLWQSNSPLLGNPINLPTSTAFPYTLPGVDPTQSSVYVQLALIDECEQPIMANAIHRSMHLRYLLEPSGNISLYWNLYEGWDNIEGQKIIKSVGTNTPEIINLPVSETNYTDNISSSADPTAAIEYRLMAFHADGRESYSNTVLYQPEFEPLMPNAFRPRSDLIENTVFNPVIPLTNSKTYRLRIFDRWGGVIFETLDPLAGWDGKRKTNELWPQGVYVYSIEYENATGVIQVKRGNVMLLH